ncbi:MAG: glycoside hydrolase domain-containing protein [Nocardioides sp.]
MFRAIPRSLVRTLAWLLAAAVLTVPVRADADNVATPGNFTGYGFDQCVAPTQKAMNAWLRSSPFLAVGIYISGDSRGCRSQPNLSKRWVSTQLGKGWRLLPITLGPQASCHPSFPRYRDDKTINPRPGDSGTYRRARRQARSEANSAVTAAQALGIVKRSTLWYDLEGFDVTKRHCRESALAFLSAWTTRIRALGYVSGVYSSAGSGIKMLDDARVNRPDKVVLPDRIWIARWDGKANTSTDYIRDDGWLPGNRMKQYRGGHNETWGGVTINIDSNWLDLGKGSFARPVAHCNGVDVDHSTYRALSPGTSETALVKALQCLLREKGRYDGKLSGRYNARTVAAARAWRKEHGFSAGGGWNRLHWMSLLADGSSSPVLKFGSAGENVRRVQRALKAAGATRLKITGRYSRRTAVVVRNWQDDIGHRDSGIVTGRSWRALRAGRR